VDSQLAVKISDFGMAQLFTERATRPAIGTSAYMAPELLLNHPTGKAADIFSFGILLWELFVGVEVFPHMMEAQIIMKVLVWYQSKAKDATDYLPLPDQVPAPLASLVKLCLDREPDHRPTFADITVTLQKALEEEQTRLASLEAS
jgi:serine/threonine protein kinase